MNESQLKFAEMLEREYDVFDVWSVEGDKLILPTESTLDTKVSDEMIDEESIDELLGKVASVFGNELLPLLQNARSSKGVDVLDKREVVLYLKESGEEDWSNYVNGVSDKEWEQFAYQIDDDNVAFGSKELSDFVFNYKTYKTDDSKEIFAKIIKITS